MTSRLRLSALAAARVGKLVGLAFAYPLIPTAGLAGLASAYWVWSDDPSLLMLSLTITLHVVAGAAGSYLLHEIGHVVAIGLCCREVQSIEVRHDSLRISVLPRGAITRAESIVVALAGPGLCGLFGLTLVQTTGLSIAWWFIAHTIFLIPPFGDGMSILTVLKGPAVARSDGDVTRGGELGEDRAMAG